MKDQKEEEKEKKENKVDKYFNEKKILNNLKEKTNQMNVSYENLKRKKGLKNILNLIIKEEINKNKEKKIILMFTIKILWKFDNFK